MFKNHVANQRGNDGNHEIGERENIFNCESQTLSPAICVRKFPHEKVGIEEEAYESNFDDRPPDRGGLPRLSGSRCHL